MQLRPAQLASHLSRKLAPLYMIHGDEPLLAMEAADQIRAAARASGFEDREVLVVDLGFKWDAFCAANRNLGLFGGRKIIDLRIPSGKPGVEGARALEACATDPSPDTLTLISLPRVDRATQSSAWFSALERRGVSIAIYPLERDELPQWIAMRLAKQKQHADEDTLRFLADATEGNLLAARQEIEKLALLLPPGNLSQEAVERAVADVARFDVFQLSEAWLAGDAARVCRILAVLEGEGEGPPLLLWQLGDDLHTLAAVLAAKALGTPVPAAIKSTRVWGKRQAAMERAATRVSPALIAALIVRLARIEALAKGIGLGSFWDELRELALAFAGHPVTAPG